MLGLYIMSVRVFHVQSHGRQRDPNMSLQFGFPLKPFQVVRSEKDTPWSSWAKSLAASTNATEHKGRLLHRTTSCVCLLMVLFLVWFHGKPKGTPPSHPLRLTHNHLISDYCNPKTLTLPLHVCGTERFAWGRP